MRTLTGLLALLLVLAPAAPAAGAEGYHAAFFSESAFLALAPGGTGQFSVGFTNSGSLPWVKGASEARLRTSGPLNNRNAFDAGWSSGWAAPDTYAVQTQDVVNPGDIGFFTYSIRVPANATASYTFAGRLWIEGVGGLEDVGYYHVVAVAVPVSAPSPTPSPSPVPVLPTPTPLAVTTPTPPSTPTPAPTAAPTPAPTATPLTIPVGPCWYASCRRQPPCPQCLTVIGINVISSNVLVVTYSADVDLSALDPMNYSVTAQYTAGGAISAYGTICQQGGPTAATLAYSGSLSVIRIDCGVAQGAWVVGTTNVLELRGVISRGRDGWSLSATPSDYTF